MDYEFKSKKLSIYDAFSKIEKLYHKGHLPLIDGIITKEKYIKIDVKYNYGCKGEITSFIEEEHFDNISLLEKSCSSIGGHTMEYENFIINYGEGSWGGDGYIVIMNKAKNVLWIMFHSFINPIEIIEIEENKIIGINNCHSKFEFKINWKEI